MNVRIAVTKKPENYQAFYCLIYGYPIFDSFFEG